MCPKNVLLSSSLFILPMFTVHAQDNPGLQCARTICGRDYFEPVNKPEPEPEQIRRNNDEMEPVKQAILKFVNSEVDRLKAKSRFLYGDLTTSAVPTREVVLVYQVHLVRQMIDIMTGEKKISSPQITPEDVAKLLSEGELTSLQKKLVPIVVRASNNRNLLSTLLNKLGPGYAYRYLYPKLNFKQATRAEVQDALSSIDRSSAHASRAIRLLRLKSQLTAIANRFPGDIFIDEISAIKIREAASQVYWITYVADAPEAQWTDEEIAEAWRRYLKIAHHDDVSIGGRPSHEAFNELSYVDPEFQTKNAAETLKAKYENMGYELAKNLGSMTGKEPTRPAFLPKSYMSHPYMDCVMNALISAATLPTQAQIDAFKAIEPEIRNRVKAGFIAKLPQDVHSAAEQLVDTQEFFYPPDQPTFLKRIAKQFDKAAEDNLIWVANVREGKHDYAWAQLIASGDLNETPGMRTENFCGSALYPPVRDHTIQELGGVTVGSEAIKDPAMGIGVESHELGHGLSHLLANSRPEIKESYLAVGRCLDEMHKNYFDDIAAKNATMTPVQLPGREGALVWADFKDKRSRHYYREEDFADLVAVHASPEHNIWCPMLKMSPPQENPFAPGKYLVNVSTSDVHANPLLRLLHFEVEAGRPLKEACERLVQNEKYVLKKCF